MYTAEELEDLRKIFAARLVAVVEARGYPKNNFGRNTKLAEDLGVSAPYVYKLFHGQIGSTLTLRKIAIILETTTDYLLGLSDDMDTESYKQKKPNLPEQS